MLALTVAAYMYLRCKPRSYSSATSTPVRWSSGRWQIIPKFGGRKRPSWPLSWDMLDHHLGNTWTIRLDLGGATLIAVGAMFLFRIISWEDDIQRGVAFDVVGLYAAVGRHRRGS